MSAGFCHLHVHSEYSVLDGASRVAELVDRAKKYNMKACALTDHGAMFGAIDFYQAAKRAGIKPIIGCELYVAMTERTRREGRSSGSHHFLMLCENNLGYHNLCALSSLGYLEGFHYRPRVDMELLAKYREGLIATSSCLGGEIPQYLLNDELDKANEAVKKFVALYGKEHFLIELQDHGLPEQRKINPLLRQLAADHGLTVIATNDTHYTDREDADSHDVLLAIQTGAKVQNPDRLRFSTKEFYFTSPEEMLERFKDCPEAVYNTERIADRCNVEIALDQHLIPEYAPPEGMDKATYLHRLVLLGLEDRYGGAPSKLHIERAEYELSVINDMKFTDYFLVVWDLINYARLKGIPVGPGRGSGAGSLVAYALKITNIDPIRYHLLFERFLNPERVSMPDFDIDFCFRRRDDMIKYAREKYGAGNVSQIITFGRMLAKKVIRDVGRAMDIPLPEVDRLAKLVPDELGIKLKDAQEKEPELKRLIEQDPITRELWRHATRLEGTIGNPSTHAAGVVICDKPLIDLVPLFKASGSDIVATQFEMKNVEQVGLLKMDFLGLRTLTVVHDAVKLVKENRGLAIDIDHLEPDDAKTYALLRSGKTTGIFQLESSGMRELAKRIGLESLEEICALVALYRPGPMALKDDYIQNKFEPGRIQYEHPLLEPILRETYGIALYQEQVMQIVQAVAGFTLGGADILRRAMGKKKADLMAQQRQKFVEGAKRHNNIDEATATRLFNTIEKFAGYGFNKSHSMAYAYVAYQTAFLKANYPVEFMAALLSSEMGNLTKVGIYVEECRQMGLEVRPPDINKSSVDFSVEGRTIRFGMGAIKNLGEAPVEAIVTERTENGPFADLFDFCARIDTRSVNRRCIESLNRAGAFGSTGWRRSQVEAALDDALSAAQLVQRERAAGQFNLLDLMQDDSGSAPVLREKPDRPEWPDSELLAYEKEMLGLYVSSHPLARHAAILEGYSSTSIADLPDLKEGKDVLIGGLLATIKRHVTKNGKRMAFLTLETLEGSCELTVFSEVFEKRFDLLQEDRIVMAEARVSVRNGEVGLIANDLIPIEEVSQRYTKAVHIRVNLDVTASNTLERLAQLLGERPGACDVYLHCVTGAAEEVVVHATDACKVLASEELQDAIGQILGTGACWGSGGHDLPRHA